LTQKKAILIFLRENKGKNNKKEPKQTYFERKLKTTQHRRF
jgi:hypothetical protein